MNSLKNNENSGNNGLTKKFCKNLWNQVKTPLMESANQTFHIKTLSISQRETVIHLLRKKTGINDTCKTGDQFPFKIVTQRFCHKLFKKIENCFPWFFISLFIRNNVLM